MIHSFKSLWKEGGFNLTKLWRNHLEFLKSIPHEYKKDILKWEDLNLGILPEDKALGVKKDIQENTLRFNIKMNDKQAT